MEVRENGQIVLLKFPQTDLNEGKLRPVLLISKLPGEIDDWLVCMISTKMTMFMEGIDVTINESVDDFKVAGLKSTSIFRVLRVAVINKEIMLGKIGKISDERLLGIKSSISKWLLNS